MKKIILLFVIICTLLLLTIVHIISFFYPFQPSQIVFESTVEIIQFVLYICTLIILIIAHLITAQGLWHMREKGFFDTKSIKSFAIGGKLFIATGLIIFLISLYNLWSLRAIIESPFYTLFDIFKNGYSIVLGLGLLILVDFAQKGAYYKQENDLTI